ncbi:MAG TPA: hypothetical protein VMH87_05725 [Pseudomonadales bacterium]|nr:hypothetical protein [Pseudomonadales bacterium]
MHAERAIKFLFCFTLVLACAFIIPNGKAAILYPQAPEGGVQAVSNALDSKFLKPVTHLPPAKDLTISMPVGVYYYVLKYTNLFSGQFLSATRLSAWRFFLADVTNSAALQLGYDAKKEEWQVTEWTFYHARSKSSDPFLQTLRVAENLPQVKEQDYELRYLDLVQFPFSAFWLHGKSNDIIIPVPMYGKWQDLRPYSESEMTGILKREMEEKMKQPRYKAPGIPVG